MTIENGQQVMGGANMQNKIQREHSRDNSCLTFAIILVFKSNSIEAS